MDETVGSGKDPAGSSRQYISASIFFLARRRAAYEPFIKAGVTELFPVPWIFTVAAQPVPRLLRRRSDRINPAAVAFSLLVAAIRCPLQLLRLVVYTTGAVTNGRSAAESLSLLIKKGKLTSLLKR